MIKADKFYYMVRSRTDMNTVIRGTCKAVKLRPRPTPL